MQRSAECFGGELPVLARQRRDLESAERCMRAAFAGDDVRADMGENFIARPAMGENQMRLKAESSIARRQFVYRLSDEWEIGEKPERADQTRMVSFGLIGAKFAFGEIVDVDQVGPRPLR